MIFSLICLSFLVKALKDIASTLGVKHLNLSEDPCLTKTLVITQYVLKEGQNSTIRCDQGRRECMGSAVSWPHYFLIFFVFVKEKLFWPHLIINFDPIKLFLHQCKLILALDVTVVSTTTTLVISHTCKKLDVCFSGFGIYITNVTSRAVSLRHSAFRVDFHQNSQSFSILYWCEEGFLCSVSSAFNV